MPPNSLYSALQLGHPGYLYNQQLTRKLGTDWLMEEGGVVFVSDVRRRHNECVSGAVRQITARRTDGRSLLHTSRQNAEPCFKQQDGGRPRQTNPLATESPKKTRGDN